MTDQLTAWSIARQQREPVDATRLYKRLLSLGHTMEELDKEPLTKVVRRQQHERRPSSHGRGL